MNDDRSLRELRLEARVFQEDLEATVAEHAASDRSMRDALIDYGKAGYRVRVEANARSLVGQIEHVGTSLVRLATVEGHKIDIATPAIAGVRVDVGIRTPCSVTTGHPGSMIARMREAIQTDEVIHIERQSGESVDGKVVAVLAEAVEVQAAGALWLIPLDAICWIWRK